MELAHIQTFLILAEEEHFGRTGSRLCVSAARVSQRIRAMENDVGGPLFERSSRRVKLTLVGSRLRDRLDPIYRGLTTAMDSARARNCSPGLRIGFTAATGGRLLTQLVRAFRREHPQWPVSLHELAADRSAAALYAREIDVLVSWAIPGRPELCIGPVLDRQPRVLAVAADHPLARSTRVSGEVLADYPTLVWGTDPTTATPSGRSVRPAATSPRTLGEVASALSRERCVYATVPALSRLLAGEGIVTVPITDLPSLPVGLLRRARDNDTRIRALATVARTSSG